MIWEIGLSSGCALQGIKEEIWDMATSMYEDEENSALPAPIH